VVKRLKQRLQANTDFIQHSKTIGKKTLWKGENEFFETKDNKEEQCKKEVEKRESTIGHYAYKVQWLKKIGKCV